LARPVRFDQGIPDRFILKVRLATAPVLSRLRLNPVLCILPLMLRTLRVKNLAIVENVRVEFDDGLNVITGETGAGKSIIAGALGLVLGERADRGMIRSGEDKCGVEASFELPDPSEIDTLLEDLGIQPCEDGRLIVRRIIAASGGGKNLVNDCPATLQALRQIGDLLVDLHGPHDHQSLLSQAFQLDILDSYGHLWKQRAAYEDIYHALVDLDSQREALDGDDEAVAEQIDFLKFQIKEIDDADLDGADEDALEQEHTTAANATRIMELAGAARDVLTDAEAPAFDALVFAQKQLSELAGIFTEADEWRSEAESIAVQIQELSGAINSAVQNIEADPQRLQWLEDRQAILHKLKRKYGGTLEEVRHFVKQTRTRLEDLETRGEKIKHIESEINRVRSDLVQLAERLSIARRKAAKALAKAITAQLHDLGFPHGAFDVVLGSKEPGPSGTDEIEFGFAPNVGESTRPLRSIASSGEISRVMLAVKAVLAEHDRIPVLVFDEIDTNVGGEMGNAIGNKMTAVAANHQVICITHLPQVAVHGKHHFVVVKTVAEGRTKTEITPLTDGNRVEEIARMLGGRDSTSVALRHAREMLKACG